MSKAASLQGTDDWTSQIDEPGTVQNTVEAQIPVQLSEQDGTRVDRDLQNTCHKTH